MDNYPSNPEADVANEPKSLLELFKIAVDSGDATGIRIIGAAMAHKQDPDARNRVKHIEHREDGTAEREMENGDFYLSEDGGKSWWLRYSAMSDLYYMSPDDPCGFYMP